MSSCLAKNRPIGSKPSLTYCKMLVSTHDWWLQMSRYLPSFFKSEGKLIRQSFLGSILSMSVLFTRIQKFATSSTAWSPFLELSTVLASPAVYNGTPTARLLRVMALRLVAIESFWASLGLSSWSFSTKGKVLLFFIVMLK